MTMSFLSFETNSPFFIRVCLTMGSRVLDRTCETKCDGRRGFKIRDESAASEAEKLIRGVFRSFPLALNVILSYSNL